MSEEEEDNRRILGERARSLARPALAVADATSMEVLLLSVGGEQLAVDVRFVREVARLPELTRVPDVPAQFLGVVNFGSEVLPIVDLLALLGNRRTVDLPRWMVVIGELRAELGLAVDEAESVVRIRSWVETTGTPLIRGVLDGHRSILAGDVLLADPRLFIFGGTHAMDNR